MDENRPLLEVSELHVRFSTPRGVVRAVNGISYQVKRGEILGIVGESGSGKTVQSYSLLGLLPPGGAITGGDLRFDGLDLRSKRRLRQLRGQRIGMVFQDPAGSLNPFYTIGRQLTEAGTLPRRQRRARAVQLLQELGIPDAEDCMTRYTHELSGGQQQRVMLAVALMNEPELLIADEPTTALDVTLQAQILALLRRIQEERGLSILFITHNLAVVAQLCARLIVMYAGVILEEGTVAELFAQPRSPYTRALLESIPRLHEKSTLTAIPGLPPDPLHPPSGCPFAPRCAAAMPRCHAAQPELREVSPGHRVACFLAEGGDGHG